MVVVLHLGLGLFDVRTKNTTQKERFKTINLNVVAYLQCIIKIISNMTALFKPVQFDCLSVCHYVYHYNIC